MEDSTNSALVAVETMVLSAEKVSAKRSGKVSKDGAKVGAVSARGAEEVVMTGGVIVVFGTTTGARSTGVTASGASGATFAATTGAGATATGVTLATGAGAAATPRAGQCGGAGLGAGVMKFTPGTVKAAGAFLVLLLRGMMKICLWLLVSVLVGCWLFLLLEVRG